MKNVLIEGHRGYCAKYPENTLVSFAAAMELAVDAIEFDVWLTSDKVPVIIHDGNAYRTAGVDKHVRDMTFAEVKTLDPAYVRKFGDEFVGKTSVPSLEELLLLVKEKRPDLRLGVEIKEMTEECVDLTVALLKKHGYFDTCWFYAFNGRIIRYIKEKHGGRTMGYPDFQMPEFCGYEFYDEIGLGYNIVTSEILDLYMKKGFPAHMYCADTPEQVMTCLERGASLITANDPTALIKIVKGE